MTCIYSGENSKTRTTLYSHVSDFQVAHNSDLLRSKDTTGFSGSLNDTVSKG